MMSNDTLQYYAVWYFNKMQCYEIHCDMMWYIEHQIPLYNQECEIRYKIQYYNKKDDALQYRQDIGYDWKLKIIMQYDALQ